MTATAARYNRVYQRAVARTLDAYDEGLVLFTSEHDLQAELMGQCRAMMLHDGFDRPLRLSSDVGVSPSAGQGKVARYDLVLGLRDEVHPALTNHVGQRPFWCLTSGAAVVAELKFERLVSPSIQRSRTALTTPHYLYSGTDNELAADLAKLASLPPTIDHGHFLAVDEKGFWRSKVSAEDVARLTGARADWEQRATRAGHPYWVLAVEVRRAPTVVG